MGRSRARWQKPDWGVTVAAMRDTVVVKYGGAAMTSAELKAAVMDDIAALVREGFRVTLVHGGGPEIEALLAALGRQSRFINGLRYTDGPAMEAVLMALCGKVNKELSAALQAHGARAVGISGLDGCLLSARRLPGLGLVGEVESVNTALLGCLLAGGFVPVVSPVALDADSGGAVLNVNADTAAAGIAAALGAGRFVLLTDVPGLLRDVADPASLIPEMRLSEIAGLKTSGVIRGGMIPKLACCEAALSGGALSAQIVDGRVPHILRAAVSGAAPGTTVLP